MRVGSLLTKAAKHLSLFRYYAGPSPQPSPWEGEGAIQTRLYNRAMDRPAHHYHPLVRTVARALRERCGVEHEAAIVVACSGGADSVALLRVLSMLADRRKWRLKLIVGHVQHHLRDAAEADAAFVEALAQELGLPYVRKDVRPGDLPGNMEANARRLRYQALGEIAAAHDASLIATAHHADDQLETLLMRILRGSSVAGLRGIAWSKAQPSDQGKALAVIRPMLGVNQDEITALLDRLGQPYREDATNLDTDRTRAKLRHEVLPVLKEIQNDAPQKAGELVEHFRDLYEVLRADAAEELEQAEREDGALTISRQAARKMNCAILSEMLRQALIDLGVPAGRVTRNALLPVIAAAQDTAGGTRSFAFANSTRLVVTSEVILIITD